MDFSAFIFLITILCLAPDYGTTVVLEQDGNEQPDNQLEGGRTRFSGWSSWGQWSTCSRSCDGGITKQSRTCLFKSGCRGDSLRYRICNMRSCPDDVDFRAVQCSSHNDRKFEGELHDWVPVRDPSEPCSLSCKSTKTSVVAVMDERVVDGTRCRHGSLDMCLSGSCMTVGCDLKLGSSSKIDECGICGGDGSTCRKRTLYYWEETDLTKCSVTCGGGFQMSHPVCRDRHSGQEVNEMFCDMAKRLHPVVQECNTLPCPSVWQTEAWSVCSSSCNGGIQMRAVYCVEGKQNGTQVRVDDRKCPRRRPHSEKSCNTMNCPQWDEGPWSECSVTCGHGYRIRPVICRDHRGRPSQTCDIKQKPATRERCKMADICLSLSESSEENRRRRPSVSFHSSLPRPQHQNSASQDPRFVADDWSACSTSCGWGVRFRNVKCKVFRDFNQEVDTVPQHNCKGAKPASKERCFSKPCDFHVNSVDEVNPVEKDQRSVIAIGGGDQYTWRTSGFTACSASCLGGVRESITQCVRNKDDSVVSPHMCDLSAKPDQLIQTCNNRPCPPRWNVSDFTPCTKRCGAGKQQRTMQCIHEVTRGNVLTVAKHLCPQPPPRTERFCGVVSCPIRWKTGSWSSCSKPCGGGIKTRKVKCQRTLAYGQIVDQPMSRCRRKKPKTVKVCKTRACPRSRNNGSPKIISDTKQLYVQSKNKKKIALKVGGKAKVYKGVNLKLKCQIKGRFNRTKLIWIKDRDYIQYHKRMKISRNGALRIKSVMYSDSGLYICRANKVEANITIIVKPNPNVPPSFYNSIEDASSTVENHRDHGGGHHTSRKRKKKHRQRAKVATDAVVTKDDNYSHENVDRKADKWKHRAGNAVSLSPIEILKRNPSAIYANQNDKSQSVEGGSYDTWEYRQGNGRLSRPFQSAVSSESHEINARPQSGNKMATKSPFGRVQTSTTGSEPAAKRFLTQMYATTPLRERLESIEDGSHEDFLSTKEVLGKGRKEQLKFDWVIGEWSKCTVDCGGTGYQVRTTQCLVRLNNVSKNVDNMLCTDAGLSTPVTIRQCGMNECPQWIAGRWSECANARCVNLKTAMMRRNVRCQLPNGAIVPNRQCNRKTKPRQKRECRNEKCKGTWKVGEWSKVRRRSSARRRAGRRRSKEGSSSASGTVRISQPEELVRTSDDRNSPKPVKQ